MKPKKGIPKNPIREDSLFFHTSREASTDPHFYTPDYVIMKLNILMENLN